MSTDTTNTQPLNAITPRVLNSDVSASTVNVPPGNLTKTCIKRDLSAPFLPEGNGSAGKPKDSATANTAKSVASLNSSLLQKTTPITRKKPEMGSTRHNEQNAELKEHIKTSSTPIVAYQKDLSANNLTIKVSLKTNFRKVCSSTTSAEKSSPSSMVSKEERKSKMAKNLPTGTI